MEHYFVTCPEIADLHESLESPISSNDVRTPEPADFPKVLGLVSGVLERRRWLNVENPENDEADAEGSKSQPPLEPEAPPAPEVPQAPEAPKVLHLVLKPQPTQPKPKRKLETMG